ncbi:hypothetical protein [Histidinibacterium aquaticum]|uniref:hypothetical protein n=1 Tax=Histidinibacterium aquaticum TaxID=2613962 RepID=UPI00168A99AE|nr:hypothetical protein [Histidinibacterium aquaticum]
MTMFSTVRTAIAKRAQYNRTVRELRSVPAGLAVEDLGFFPGDANRIARDLVYGR